MLIKKMSGFLIVICSLCQEMYATESDSIDPKVYQTLKNVAPSSSHADLKLHSGIGMYYFQTDSGIDGYISKDGKYIIPSRLLRVKDDGVLVDETRKDVIEDLLILEDSNFIIYESTTKERGEVIVMGDVTCEYCALFHNLMGEINDAGITVKYLLFPRGGLNSKAAKVMKAIICSSDPRQAFTESMNQLGKVDSIKNLDIDSRCESEAVEIGFLKGKALRVRGTPNYLFEDGIVRNGYMMAEDVVGQALYSRKEVLMK